MKITTKTKLISMLFLILVGLNIAFLKIVYKTDISWLYFFVINLLLAIPYYLLFYFVVLKQSKKQKEVLNKEFPFLSNTELISNKNKMMLALSLGYFFYIISFSTLPFAFNYYFSKGKLKHYKTTVFGAHDEDLYDADKLANNGLQQSTFTKVVFKHEDVIFSINIGKTKSSKYLYYTMDEGFFGWNVVKKVHFL